MDTRKEDVKTLQEMQAIQRKLQTISKDLEQLDKDEDNVSIDHKQYKTNHANTCIAEIENKKQAATDAYTKKKKNMLRMLWFIPVCGIVACFAILYLARNFAMFAVLVAILSFVVRAILASLIKKQIQKKCDEEIYKITSEYEIKLKEAKAADSKEQRRYNRDLEEARKKLREENQLTREELKKQKKEYENKLNQIRIISNADMKNIPALIKILESNRADNIKEALRVIDEQQQREKETEERRRREKAKAEQRRQAEEEARLATMPGTVHIRIGSINTYTGKLQTVRNTIYLNGAMYGTGDATGTTTFQLNPGVHNIYAQLQEAGYIFTSPNQSFTLPGNGHVYLKIMIKNARASIQLCSSESDFWSN